MAGKEEKSDILSVGYHAMPAGSHERLFRHEDSHWWCRTVRRITLDALARHGIARNGLIIDAGCGSGGLLREISEYGNALGVELAAEALRFAASATGVPLLRANVRRLPFVDNCADAVVALDLLCNMEGDFEVETLMEIRRVLRPRGLLFMNLPAHRFMAGAHDLRMGVRRRYETSDIINFTTESGFRILELFHWNLVLMPGAYLMRKLTSLTAGDSYSDLALTPRWLDPFLFQFMRVDVTFCRLIRSPLGISIFCVAERKD